MLYKFIATLIIGMVVSVALIIVVVDFVEPSFLKNIDNKITEISFKNLRESHRHNEAIFMWNFKKDFMNSLSADELLFYKLQLADSYTNVGDFSNAENILLESYESIPSFIEKYADADDKDKYIDLFRFVVSRNIYKFYEQMGDVNNQLKYYHIYMDHYRKSIRNFNIDRMYADYAEKVESSLSYHDKNAVSNSIKYDSIVVLSLTNEAAAMEQMENFITMIRDDKAYNNGFKVECLNKLIEWQLKNGYLPKAYDNIFYAIKLTSYMKSLSERYALGTLAEHCYAIHEKQLSKKLYKMYDAYVEEYYSPSDLVYLSNKARQFKYITDNDELTRTLQDYCQGMRHNITINMPSMSGEQRENIAKTFDQGYYYAFRQLKTHPSDELAGLCFDNMIFKSGLLLRSDTIMKQKIRNLSNPRLEKMYHDLDSCRKELRYRTTTKKIILDVTNSLEKKIDEMEKELALASTDFRHKNDFVMSDYHTIQKSMNDNEAVVELIQHDDDLFALLLNKEGAVKYIPLCNMDAIKGYLKHSINDIYNDVGFTEKIYGKLSTHLKQCKKLYYVPNGIFSQIALETLCTGRNQYLYDNLDVCLLSNPSDLMALSDFKMEHNDRYVSLWGGVDYGSTITMTDTMPNTRAAIKRGEQLVNLRYSALEVTDISGILKSLQFPVNLYTGSKATEESFKERTDKGDYILHVSTHGFFNDRVGKNRSMLESGLLFAGANKYWSNDSITVSEHEDDGILQAEEISGLNLSQCSLVVLSACETGLGFSQSSEGVYGLQRAFKLAGVRQVLMSLWDVDDRATSILMTEFYKSLTQGDDADEALRKSKNKVRSLYPSSPEYWGGFVLLH